MRYKNKSTSIRVALRLFMGLTTSLFVLSLTNALNAENVTSHKGRFWKAKPVGCGDTLENGYFELTGHLDCSETDKTAIKITGPAKLNLNGYTLSGNKDIVCIQIEGEGASVWNGTVKNCKDGIQIKSDRNRIIKVNAYNNEKRGFKIDNGHENLLLDCLAEGEPEEPQKIGFLIEKGTDNKMVKCKAKNNVEKGFSIEKNGEHNRLFWCVAENNGEQGFKIEEGDGNKIYYSKAIANCRDGIEIDAGSDNLIIHNLVEDNGNKDTCIAFEEDHKPQFYAGIDITAGTEEHPSEYNEIKYNHACGNIGCNGEDCNPRERNYWDEKCEPTNEWENNTVCPECTPGP